MTEERHFDVIFDENEQSFAAFNEVQEVGSGGNIPTKTSQLENDSNFYALPWADMAWFFEVLYGRSGGDGTKYVLNSDLPDLSKVVVDENYVHTDNNFDNYIAQFCYDIVGYLSADASNIASKSYVAEALGNVSVDLTDYVKNTDYATHNKAGVVKVITGQGITMDNGVLSVAPANNNTILAKNNYRQPIVPAYLDYAVKVGLTTNTQTLTDEEKSTAQNWLGINGVVDDIKSYVDEKLGVIENGSY